MRRLKGRRRAWKEGVGNVDESEGVGVEKMQMGKEGGKGQRGVGGRGDAG